VSEARRYEVILRGCFDPSWSDWFDALELDVTPDGRTVMHVAVPDQAALHGVLARVRDLGVELLSLRQLA
jgi:hypothetical protein